MLRDNTPSYDLSPLLNMCPHYKGTPTENPYWHIREIVYLCRTQNVQGLTQDEIRLILFPFSLKDNAKTWYYSFAAGSIHTWDEMTTKFLKKFFPAHKTRQLRREILTFQQKDGALFFEAWEHFNELLLRCPHHNLSQDDQVLAFYEGLNDPNKSLVDIACGYMLMEKSSEEAIELFKTLSENSQQFPSKGRQGLKGKGRHEESTNGGIRAQMAAIEKKLDMLMKAVINHISAPESSLINLSQHYHEEEPSSTYWPQQYQEKKPSPIYDHSYFCFSHSLRQSIFKIEDEPSHSYSCLSPSLWQSIFKIEAHEEEPPPVNWLQQCQEEECQSQFVANYNEYYMEEECTYYREQTSTTPKNEKTVREMFSEPSLEDPLEESFDQFHEQVVVENQVDEKKEEQIEDLEEPHQEKEVSTKTFSTLALIPETPRGQERSLLELPIEQIEDIKIEKLPESSSYFIPVHDEKLFEKTQSGPPIYTDNWNPPAMGRHHSLWCKRRKDWCFKFKVS